MQKRPKALHTSQSFTRLEAASQSPLSRSRASTIQGPPVPDILFPRNVALSPESEEVASGDIFATKDTDDSVEDGGDGPIPDAFEELPIEIRSLTERFLESLSAKVHPSPLSIDALSDLFQDFYTRSASHINTHIATLSSRISRGNSASPARKGTSTPTKPGSLGGRKRGDSTGSEQQMLTASEITDRKKARRQLELKRAALEEAVERVACEKVYERIWRHRSTDDEERDQKLRSRTAALSLVGIGLKELLMNTDEVKPELKEKTSEKEEEIREWLSAAREDIQRMDDEKYPLGKLQHLTAAHKSIVEALSKIFPASSSADEILPTLIYTLITSPPDTINVVSNLKFIQRFRGSSRMDGESAYCLVNLEAAISFLETVDLSSLRADEGRTSTNPTTPRTEITPMKLGLSPPPDLPKPSISAADATSSDIARNPPASPTTKSQRRLSNLIQAQTNRIEAASDAVRGKVLDSADQAIDTINNTLENSFKFLFGRLKEQQQSQSPSSPVQVPKTLEDARKLVSAPPPNEEDNGNASAASSIAEQGDDHAEESSSRPDLNSRMSDIFGGRNPNRDRSVDSTKSGGSGKRVSFTTENKSSMPPPAHSKTEPVPISTTPPTVAGNAAVESMRNLGNSLNPLNRFANINVIPRFGRTTSSSASTPAGEQSKQLPLAPPTTSPKNTSPPSTASTEAISKEAKAMAVLEGLRKTTPPVKRFVEIKDPKELKLGEVDELLKEYQRLAGALREAINSSI